MIPSLVARSRPLALVLLAIGAVVLAGCSAAAGESFDPQGSCTTDGQRPGAYPELEALVPESFDGRTPDTLDSGRNCSEANLGTLAAAGIGELRFAGGLWPTGGRSGVSIAVFRGPGLTAGRLAEFYESGARAARKTENVTSGPYEVDGVQGRRVDTLNDESFQTIVVLDSGQPDLVRAVLVASDVREIGTREAHEAVVARATRAATAP